MPNANPTVLIAAADRQIANLRSQGKDYSFNELANMYNDKELVIDPEFQRLFRWSESKESRFIESLILELPLPPIFVIEINEGQYELIDGLQRFASYLHFRGELDAPHRDISKGVYLTLQDCDIVRELNGLTYGDLPTAFQIRLKRHTIRAEVIRRESDKRLRYHMFKRLNTGGEQLSDQEIRNCTIRLLDNRFNQFLIDLSRTQDFVNCIANVGQDRLEQKYDQELVLRFFAFKNWGDRYVKDVGQFLTRFMESVTDAESSGETFDSAAEEAIFRKTFGVLKASMGPDAFAQIVQRRSGEATFPFTVYQFESFTLGLQPHLSKLDPADATQMQHLKELCWEIKRHPAFQEVTTGGGRNTRNALNERLGYVRDELGARL
jgi:hypothetical protein